MKTTLALSLMLAVPALAGTASQQMTEYSPPAEPSSWSWFIGGTAGYLLDFEEDMYTLQFGVDSPKSFAGWNVGFYLEGGWTEFDQGVPDPDPGFPDLDTEFNVYPATFNLKFEKSFGGGPLGAYFGLGAGYSYVDGDADSADGTITAAGDDWVSTGQVFGGLVYTVNDNFKVFGGARWIYFDDAEIDGIDIEFEDDVLIEAGLRFSF